MMLFPPEIGRSIIWIFVELALAVVVITFIFEGIPLVIQLFLRRKKFDGLLGWSTERNSLQGLRKLTPDEFEYFIRHLFEKLGYSSIRTGGKGDGGVDVIAEKDGKTHLIQCKKFITSKVGAPAVQHFFGAMADNLTNVEGYFITTNVFTLDARRYAEDKPIELIDGQRLLEYIKMAGMKPEEYFSKVEKCSKCGAELVRRHGRYGDFLGCQKYPACDFTKKI